jgi:hypothetical protein
MINSMIKHKIFLLQPRCDRCGAFKTVLAMNQRLGDKALTEFLGKEQRVLRSPNGE